MKHRIGSISDFPAGQLVEVNVEGKDLLVSASDSGVCAALNKCPHLGLSLTSGPGGKKFEDGVIRCPWHNSRFTLCDGENLDWVPGVAGVSIPRWSRKLVAMGKQPTPLTTYSVSVEGEDVFVEL